MSTFLASSSRLSACTKEEKSRLLSIIDQARVITLASREEGIDGIDEFLESSNHTLDAFEIFALRFSTHGFSPEVTSTILQNLIFFTELSDIKHIEYIMFANFVLMLREGVFNANYMEIFLRSCLGIDFIDPDVLK